MAGSSVLATPIHVWSFADDANPELSNNGESLIFENVTFNEHARYGNVIPLNDGSKISFPGSLITQLQDGCTICFRLQTRKGGSYATWQDFLTFGRRNIDAQRLIFSLRWNYFITKRSHVQFYDSRNYPGLTADEKGVAPLVWHFVAISKNDQHVRIWLDGNVVTDFDGLEVDGWASYSNTFGSLDIEPTGMDADLAYLSVYDRMLTQSEIDQAMAASVPPALPGDSDPAPNCAGETMGDKVAETKYTLEEIQTYFPALEDWPDWQSLSRMDPGYDLSAFNQGPPPGEHPRLLFTGADLPAMRLKFQNEFLPNRFFRIMKTRAKQLDSDSSYWTNMATNVNAVREAYMQEGLFPGRGVKGYHGPWMGAEVDELAAGSLPASLGDTWEDDMTANNRRFIMHVLPVASFAALIDDDDAALARYAAALGTLARKFLEKEEAYASSDNYQDIYQVLSSGSIGLTYDFTYNHMSGADRSDVRRLLSAVTVDKGLLQNQHLPAFPGNTTNWLTVHGNLLPNALAIEGEEGYNETAFLRAKEGLKKWVYVATGPDGAPFEGYNKSAYAPQWLTYVAQRGYHFIGSTTSRNAGSKYEVHMMVPAGGLHVYETGIEPTSRGKTIFKAAYPDDKVVDTLFSDSVSDFFAPNAETELDMSNYPFNMRSTYGPVYEDIFLIRNPEGVSSDNLDLETKYEELNAHLKARDEPLGFYSDYRGVFTARTSWDRDAAFLYMEPRNVPGGHTHASRNEVIIGSNGRMWSERPQSVESTSMFHSVILVDGEGQGNNGGQTPPGRTVSVTQTDSLAMITGDAKVPYDHVFSRGSISGSTPFLDTPNQSRVVPSDLPWMDQAWYFLPYWFSGEKPTANTPSGHHYVEPFNTVEKAFRTSGLVRGRKPWFFIVDDFKKDAQERTYDWQFFLQSDVVLAGKSITGNGWIKVELAPQDPAGDERLTLFITEIAGRNPVASDLDLVSVKLRAMGDIDYQYLCVSAVADNANQVALVVPHLASEVVPEPVETAAGYMIPFPGQSDEIILTGHAEGYREVAVERNDSPIADWDYIDADPNQTSFRYDFGTNDGTVGEEYAGVSERISGDAYWSGDAVSSRSREADGHSDVLTNDHVHGEGASELHHKVANGIWRVCLGLTDPSSDMAGTRVRIEGRVIGLVDRLSGDDREFIHCVSVRDGELNIELAGAGGPDPQWVLSHLRLEKVTEDWGDDDNHDGIPNGIELFLGGDLIERVQMPGVELLADGSARMAFDYNPSLDMGWMFQASEDMVNWLDYDGDDPEHVELLAGPDRIVFNLPDAATGRMFCRIVVSQL